MNPDSSSQQSFQIDEFYIDLQEDGKTISLLPDEKIVRNPFPGLRPYKTSEFQLFKGRDGQSLELLNKLKETHFLAVIGSSGTGKSSLVRAGLLPQLFGGFLPNTGTKWNVAICRPGGDPLKNLSIAFANIFTGEKDLEKLRKESEIIEPLLRNSSYGVLEVNKILKQKDSHSSQSNLLVIIDQFEELFRFNGNQFDNRNNGLQEKNDFVQLLIKAASGIDSQIFLVITMRSEFLGDCVKYRDLPELINRGQYLVPQLSRKQLKEVIELPVIRAGKVISPNLVETLINEIESEKLKENLDQLPLLQHALMRTYQKAFQIEHQAEMLLEHYQGIGGMQFALANHATEAFRELGENDSDKRSSGAKNSGKSSLSENQRIAKILFQTLTDSGSDKKGGRRPINLQTIYDVARVITFDQKLVDDVINLFRKPDTSFVMPPDNTRLYPSLMIDISHESLMRNWNELKNWMEEEVKAAELYRRLNERREQNDQDGETWLRGILLRDLLLWRDSGMYNASWAKRYEKNREEDSKYGVPYLYDKNIIYLEKSKQKLEEELKEEEEAKDREQKAKRNRWIATFGIIATIISSLFGAYALSKEKIATAQKLIALEKERLAAEKSIEAQQQRDTARLLYIQADSVTKVVTQVNHKLDSSIQLERKYKAVLSEKANEISRLLAVAREDNRILVTKNDSISDLLAENQIKDEKFYQQLDDNQKTIAVDILKRFRKTNDPKYKIIANSINKAVSALEIVKTDPNLGLATAYSALQIDENAITIINYNEIYNSYLFYQQKIYDKDIVGEGQGRSQWIFADQVKKRLTTAGEDFLYTLELIGNRLERNGNIILRKNKRSTFQRSLTGPDNLDQYYDEKYKTVSYLIRGFGVYSNNLARTASKNDSLAIKLPEFSQGAFSSDGSSVILVNDTALLIYSLVQLRVINEVTLPELLLAEKAQVGNNSVNVIKVDKFSGDILIGYSNGIIEFADKNGRIKNLINLNNYITKGLRELRSIDIAENGQVIALFSDGLTIVFNKSNPLPILQQKDLGGINVYDKIAISPDGRYVCVWGNRVTLYDLQSDVTKTIFPLGYRSTSKISNYNNGDPYNDNVINAVFIDSVLITLHSTDPIQVWVLNPKYQSASTVWNSADSPYLEIPDAVENKIISVSESTFAHISDTNIIFRAIESYLNTLEKKNLSRDSIEYMLSIATDLTLRLGKITNNKGEMFLYGNTVLNLMKNRHEQMNDSKDYKKFEARLSDIIKVAVENFKLIDSTDLSLLYSAFAWSKILTKDFKGALDASLKAIEFDSTSSYSKKNLALSYLLAGDYIDAEKIYLKNKNLLYQNLDDFDNFLLYNYYPSFDRKKTTFRDLFLEDFKILKNIGVIHIENPDIIRIKKLLTD